MMVKSRYKNPDKYIERLKAIINRQERIIRADSRRFARHFGRLLMNMDFGPDHQVYIPNHMKAHIQQEIALEGEITNLGKADKNYDSALIKIKGLRLREEKTIPDGQGHDG